MMASRTVMVGTPGGSRPRTRRSARSAASAPLLEPAGPVTPAGGSGQSTAGAVGGSDCTESEHSANKRPRTTPVRIFTGDSIDTALPEAVTSVSVVEGSTASSATDQVLADSSASSGELQNEGSGKSSPQPAGATTSDAAQAATAAGSDQAAEEDKPDCGICLEKCLHPVKLPCGHIFCYLCVKGAAKQSARCAFCRAEVTEKFINNPRLLDESAVEREMTDTSSGYHWLYQGRNGWWRYDERTSRDIEEAFSQQQPSVQISVAGELYTVEFGSLTQFNDECRGRRRRVRREAADATPDPSLRCKGVAGLRKKRRRN